MNDNKAWRLLKSNKYSEALEAFTDCLKDNLDAKMFAGRSKCYNHLEQYSYALVDAKIATKLEPTEIMGWQALALCYFNISEYHDTIKVCKQGFLINPDDQKLLQLTELSNNRLNGIEDVDPLQYILQGHSHEHEHEHDHDHGHGHGHEHGHEHSHSHDFSHEHSHEHNHEHSQSQDFTANQLNHKHDHSHSQDFSSEQSLSHNHEHTRSLSLASTTSHDHNHQHK